MYISIYLHMYTYVYVHMYACMYVCMYACIRLSNDFRGTVVVAPGVGCVRGVRGVVLGLGCFRAVALCHSLLRWKPPHKSPAFVAWTVGVRTTIYELAEQDTWCSPLHHSRLQPQMGTLLADRMHCCRVVGTPGISGQQGNSRHLRCAISV